MLPLTQELLLSYALLYRTQKRAVLFISVWTEKDRDNWSAVKSSKLKHVAEICHD